MIGAPLLCAKVVNSYQKKVLEENRTVEMVGGSSWSHQNKTSKSYKMAITDHFLEFSLKSQKIFAILAHNLI